MPRPLVEVHQAGECGLRLPAEAGGYALLMVYDWASLGSRNMSLFKESGEELKFEQENLLDFNGWIFRTDQVPVRMGSRVTDSRTTLLSILFSLDEVLESSTSRELRIIYLF